MKSWVAEYSSALDARDAKEQSQARLIQAYTKLADRAASGVPAAASAVPTTSEKVSTDVPLRGKSPATSPTEGTGTSQQEVISRLRQDLANTQRSRSALESELKPLQSDIAQLRSQTSTDAKRIEALTRQVASLERRVRDREEELRGKGKLVEDAHDEMATLEMQLDVAEGQKRRLEQENAELVERWMRRKGAEADEMNERSNWQ